MAITRGQKSNFGQQPNGTSQACAWSVNPTAGSTILVFVQANTTNSFLSVADNGTTPATFTLDLSEETAGKHEFLYRASNITLPSAGSYTVTLTSTDAAGTLQIAGIEYLGVASGAPSATNTGTGTGTSVTTNSVSATGATGLYFGGFSDASGLNPETITFGATGTEQYRATDGSNFWPMAVADLIGSGSKAFTWTLGDSVSWSGVIAVYESAAADPVGRVFGTVW